METQPQHKEAYMFLLKYLPAMGVFCYMVHYLFCMCGVRTVLVDYLADTSLFSWLFLYVASSMFFCRLHRAFVCYVGIASLDIDLHRWLPCYETNPRWLIPAGMIAAGLVLFALLLALRCHEGRKA